MLGQMGEALRLLLRRGQYILGWFVRIFKSSMIRTLDVLPSSRSENFLKSYDLLVKKVNRNRKPPIDPESGEYASWFKPGNDEYFVHSDMSAKRDSTGIAMAHWDFDRDVCVLDFMLGKPVPVGGELEIRDIRKRIFELDEMGFGIYKATFDRWQSLDTIQILRSRGILAEEYSCDRNMQAYDTLLELSLSGKLDFYWYEKFMKEFKGLRILGGKKVDHPQYGSKDVTDAVAGAVTQCYLRAIEGGGRRGGGRINGTSLRRRQRGRAEEIIFG